MDFQRSSEERIEVQPSREWISYISYWTVVAFKQKVVAVGNLNHGILTKWLNNFVIFMGLESLGDKLQTRIKLEYWMQSFFL